ncbi:hypothetical protein QAD02_015674 [Eretmocerus hayati]|uniref:Uncharacterized protein n=1 Tax=Eretmocerus hayati TaxID=131215 RepID=A0ACC2PBR0_9HYME|nr:hypothetical protein QAD02_015674 [Eretmocerus hayati]
MAKKGKSPARGQAPRPTYHEADLLLATLLTSVSDGAPGERSGEPGSEDDEPAAEAQHLTSTYREAYFDGTARLRLNGFISVHRHSGLSFRTCEPGKLFEQRFEPTGESIGLLVDYDGLVFSAKLQQRKLEARLNARLLDNAWHNVNLFFRLGNLTLSAAGHAQVVANATYNSEILALPDHNVNGTLTIGEGFRGCILQGPGILFNDTVFGNAIFGACPLDNRPCGTSSSAATSLPMQGQSGPQFDWCQHSPCKNRGKCVSRPDRYECLCYARYSGPNCQIDHGSPCQSGPCLNGASCLEDAHGDYSCSCQPGFVGQRCEMVAGSRVCDARPCRNEGTCFEIEPYEDDETGSGYRCECRSGWTGRNCEIDVDECASNPCENHGKCVDRANGYSCRCDRTGYKGSNCEIDIDECAEIDPCLNGGACYNNYGGYQCACPTGFDGLNCELNINECLSQPCKNGGHCTDEVGSYKCDCSGTGFAGDHCEVALRGATCDSISCPQNSVCVRDSLGPQCVCKPGYMGSPPNCSLNHCASNPCEHGGTCNSLRDRFECACPPEWKGKNCQINVDECVSQPCQNGGTCTDRANGYSCSCTPDFMGDNCEREFDACVARPCQNNGTCTLSSKSRHEFVCECPPGFEGKVCDVDVDECVGVVCDGDKVCVDGVAGYECKCREGYREPNCTLIVDPCLNKPCGNGTCMQQPNDSYKCNCSPGYTGKHCEEDIDECKMSGAVLCVNGICLNNPGSYECYCKPGYSGDRCEVDINECLPAPCKNNGTCIDKINAFECECPPGYSGKVCDQDINECESNPCHHGATCINEIAKYTCVCPPGFTGYNCETNIDDCESQPCLNNGQCMDGVNSYSCNCTDTGFMGEHCESNIDDCEANPCQNGANCVDGIKDYKCQCYEGYTGKNCEIDINECESSPCQFNGTCLERSNINLYKEDVMNKPAIFTQEFNYANASGYECICIQGVMGKNCETNINECESNPCIEGVCMDRVGGYVCDCDEGFEGDHCQIEIDECSRYSPCQNNGSCIDRRADYDCECKGNFGGKNCSVELIGCNVDPCKNGGKCVPYVIDEIDHKFNCNCRTGFHGEICDHVTTMSLNGSSQVTVNTTREEGYDIQFRFRTTLPDGLLAMGKGPTYYMLELAGGKLNLHSSLLNKWHGVFIGSGLADSDWHKVFVAINSSHLILSANEEQTIYPINLNEGANATYTSFSTTYIGSTVSNLRKLPHGPAFFVGCTEDIVINGESIYPGTSSKHVEFLNVDSGCPRQEQCSPNPCKNNGHCTDRWSSFSCKCERPYLGNTCQYNMTAATFGYENITNGFVTVKVSDTARKAVRSIVDISMFIRTREERGDIFYLGSESNSPSLDLTKDKTFIAAQLEGGELLVRIQFNGTESYTVGGVKLNDGNNHLIQVVRNVTLVQVKINGTEYFRKTISANGQLNVTVLYLGGLPQVSRHIRQVDTRLLEPTRVSQVNFKGVIQDVQVSNGAEIMFVEVYPLKATGIPALPQFGNVTFDSEKVLKGVVSDNVCASSPCFHNGTCHVTWNDFRCECPRGYTGKTCQEMEFCELQDCPSGSKCQNLDDGYECLANATFDGVSTAFTYMYKHSEIKNLTESSIDSIKITYRSNTGGTLMHMAPKSGNAHFTVSVYEDKVTVAWKLDLQNSGILAFGKPEPDGNWTSIHLKLNNDSIECTYDEDVNDEAAPQSSQNFNLAAWYDLLLSGSVTLGGLGRPLSDRLSYLTIGSERHFDSKDGISGNSVEFIDRKLTTAIPPHSMQSGEAFKGCLGEVRIGSMLLHYFSDEQLYQNVNLTPMEFLSLQQDNASTHDSIGCRLCFESNCKNNGHCLNQYNSYVCQCPAGYAEDDCSVDIDECEDNKCDNNSTCIDGIANYTCECKPGWQGWLCDEDVNECLEKPCHHGGTCVNEKGSFHCECSDQFIGELCENYRLITCADEPCRNGSTCSDLRNLETGDNFTCSCQPGYEGSLCDTPFCMLNKCENGAECVSHEQSPRCDCPEGFTGHYCETNIDDCVPKKEGVPPCKNGGRCHDGINSFTCDCSGTGYTGDDCSEDIDECTTPPLADCGQGQCNNTLGGYVCECNIGFCGRDCKMIDPCKEADYCKNGGTCECVESGGYSCQCTPEYSGDNCTEPVHFLGSQALDIAVIVGPILAALFLIAAGSLIAFFMMARKKRATRGTYSPSAQEFSNPRVEMDNVMKPPPEERLI